MMGAVTSLVGAGVQIVASLVGGSAPQSTQQGDASGSQGGVLSDLIKSLNGDDLKKLVDGLNSEGIQNLKNLLNSGAIPDDKKKEVSGLIDNKEKSDIQDGSAKTDNSLEPTGNSNTIGGG